jgi:hypothetical protein
MSILSRLFGKGPAKSPEAAPSAEPVRHDGYDIHPEPINESGKWRVAARIVKVVDGVEKTHRLIRADTLDSADAAAAASLAKARQVIDEQGDRMFD